MSKKAKNLIIAAMVLCSINTVFSSMPANASTYSEASKGELKSLNVYRGSGSELPLRSSYYGDEIDLTSKKDYYVELKASDFIDIEAEAEGSGYVVKMFTSASKDAKGYDLGQDVRINSSTSNIYLRTYKSEEDYAEAYGNDDVTDCVKTYVIHVKKTNGHESEEELLGDDALLRSLYLSDGNIEFSKKKAEYNVNVNEDVEELVVRARPDNKNNSVIINGDMVDEEDNYERTISLEKGDNTITIRVENDEDYYNEYILNVYRGKIEGSDLDTSNFKATKNSDLDNKFINQLQSTVHSYNSWQNVNGNMKYIDGTGHPLKNKWWYDVKKDKNYYFDENGNMKKGWLLYNNKWYYFNQNGEMQTGWIQDGGFWYYLNKGGSRVTGWYKTSDEKWYYFDENGKMLFDTTIDGCTLDSSGAWIK